MPAYEFEVTIEADSYLDALKLFPHAWTLPGGEPSITAFGLLHVERHHDELLRQALESFKEKEEN